MPRTRPVVSAELDRRLCLRCGYRGRLLQGERGRSRYTCPACRCDLYARPAKSYAEMEGLHEATDDSPIPDFWPVEYSPAPVELAAATTPSPVHRRWFTRMERLVVVGIVVVVGAVVLARALLIG